MATLNTHELVTKLAAALPAPAVGRAAEGSPAALAGAAADTVPALVTFAGFIGDTIKQPGVTPARAWRVLYLDTSLRTWLLIEENGIVDASDVQDDTVPTTGRRDVLWVGRGTSVATGGTPESVQARFVTGEFTRAGDFEASAPGVTAAPETGIFCPTTPSCCYRTTRS